MMDEQGLYDIYEFWHIPFWQALWFKVLLVSIVGGVVLACAWVAVRYRRAHKRPMPSWKKSLTILQELQNNSTKHNPKAFYSVLTRTVKEYVDSCFHTLLEGKTDQEVLDELDTVRFKDLPDIRPLFKEVTRIKFGREYTLQRKMEEDIALALHFIKKSIPQESSQHHLFS